MSGPEPADRQAAASAAAIAAVGAVAFALLHFALLRLPGGRELTLGLVFRLRDGAVFALLLLSSWCVGAVALRRLGVELPPGIYRLSLALAVGFAWPMIGTLLLASAQLIAALSLLALLAAPLAWLPRERTTLAADLATLLAARLRPGWPLGLAALAGGLYLLAALSPPVWTDALTYHLTIPREYLDHGGVPAVTDNVFRNFPAAFSMLYLVAMGLGSDLLATPLHALFLVMTLVVGCEFFRLHGGPRTATLATLLLLGQWTVQHGVQRANVDFQFGFYGLAAFLVVFDGLQPAAAQSPFARAWPWIGGLFLGLSVAGKLQGVTCVAGVAALLAAGWLRRRVGWRPIALCAAVSVAVYLPTLLRNVLYSFDPFVFLLTDRFGWTFGADPIELERFRGLGEMKAVFMTRASPVTLLLTPWFLYRDGAFPTTTFDGFLDPIYLITLPLGLFFLRARPFTAAIYIYLFGFYVAWMAAAPLTRYALPILPLLAFLSVDTLDSLISRARDGLQAGLRRVVSGLVLGLTTFQLLWFAVHNPYLVGSTVGGFLEIISRAEYLAPTAAGAGVRAGAQIAALETAAGRSTPDQQRAVFMILASESYHLGVRYYNDPFYVNLGLLARRQAEGIDPLEWLRARGFGYVLFERGRIPWLLGRAHDNPLLNPYPEGLARLRQDLDFFGRRLAPRLEPVWEDGPLVLYRIPPSATASSGAPASSAASSAGNEG